MVCCLSLVGMVSELFEGPLFPPVYICYHFLPHSLSVYEVILMLNRGFRVYQYDIIGAHVVMFDQMGSFICINIVQQRLRGQGLAIVKLLCMQVINVHIICR